MAVHAVLSLSFAQAQSTPATQCLGPSPPAQASAPAPAAPTAALNQPPPLLRPALPAAPALHRQPPPLQQQARFIQPRPTLNQPPPPLIRPANSMPPRLNPRPVLSAGSGQQPPSLIGIQTESQSTLHWRNNKSGIVLTPTSEKLYRCTFFFF